ncbi:MAG: AAA family ATPase [Phycisphaerales bacterium]|nr:AAA family ATPase [Phycisphaerales bacterium]
MSKPIPAIDHAQRIRQWFGIGQNRPIQYPADALTPPEPGRLHLINGPSGSGKTRLMRRLRHRWRGDFCLFDLDAMKLPRCPTIECFARLQLEVALHLLSRVGLAEAHTWLLPAHRLSEGQRWRLKLAIALMNARDADRPAILFADEFAGCLDPLTARIVAHTLHRQIRAFQLRALIATSRDDLLSVLCPDQVIQCDFGVCR